MTKQKPFAPGDIVYLKSGSMRMCVEQVLGDEVDVVWSAFDAQEVRQATVRAIVLERGDKS